MLLFFNSVIILIRISKVSHIRGKSLIFWFSKLKGVSQNEMPPFKLEWGMGGYQNLCYVGDLRIITDKPASHPTSKISYTSHSHFT